MENRASYFLVGVFVLVLAAGGAVFALWLAKFQFDVQFARYDIQYDGSVTGLKAGSPVRYRGVRVGEVIAIRLDPDNPDRVRVTVEVEAAAPVRSDTIATLEIEGLTGGLYVLLSGTTLGSPPLTAEPGGERPVIASRPSSLQQVLEGAPELVQNVNLLVTRANELLSAENRAQFALTLANLGDFTSAISGRREEVGALIEDAGAAVRSIRGATATFEELAADLKSDSAELVDRVGATLGAIELMAIGIDRSVGSTATEARALIFDLRDSATSFSALSAEMIEVIGENREPIRDFTAAGLSELTVLLVEMQSLVVALNRVATQIERDPARFLFGNQQQGYETR